MALTVTQISLIRGEIGDDTPPTDADLDVHYTVYSTVKGVVLRVLGGRLGDLLAGAGSYSIPGVYGEDNKATIDGLRRKIAEIEARGIPGSGDPDAQALGAEPGVRHLVRHGRSRSGA